jgi:hypothetical protein
MYEKDNIETRSDELAQVRKKVADEYPRIAKAKLNQTRLQEMAKLTDETLSLLQKVDLGDRTFPAGRSTQFPKMDTPIVELRFFAVNLLDRFDKAKNYNGPVLEFEGLRRYLAKPITAESDVVHACELLALLLRYCLSIQHAVEVKEAGCLPTEDQDALLEEMARADLDWASNNCELERIKNRETSDPDDPVGEQKARKAISRRRLDTDKIVDKKRQECRADIRNTIKGYLRSLPAEHPDVPTAKAALSNLKKLSPVVERSMIKEWVAYQEMPGPEKGYINVKDLISRLVA